MALFANLITYPPLAQVSVVPPSRKELHFTVVLESSQSLPERPWEVSIWYDDPSYTAHRTTTWQALELDFVREGPHSLIKDQDKASSAPGLRRYTYTGKLPSPFASYDKVYKGRRVPFTVRYRIDQHSQWQWVYHNFGIPDGELILQAPIDPNYLPSSPVDLKAGWWSRKLASEAPGARLYLAESTEPIHSPPPGSEQDAQPERRVFGRVLSVSRWFALVRIWSPWLAPRHGNSKLHLSEPAILLSFLRSDGLHVLVLAVNGIDDVVTTFLSSDDGEIVIQARNDSGQDRKFKVLAASAWSFEIALAAVMYEMRKMVRTSATHQELVEKIPKHIRAESIPSEPDTVMISSDASPGASSPPPNAANAANAANGPPHASWLEFWYDALAFCTWNSLGQDLNTDKIINALQSFADHGISIGSLIIDDNWQSLSGKQGDNQFMRGWQDFEANPAGFPHGLKAATALIREKFPAIKDISVWHALMGYWGGIDPNGKIAQSYKTRVIKTSNSAQAITPSQQVAPLQPIATSPIASSLTAVDPADIGRMYNDFYRFLSESGVSGVKTDAQFMLDELASTLDRREFTTTYLSAWTQAHLTYLTGKAISCMSCTPQVLFGSLLPTATPRIILRNSDDFFPDIAESHPWHVFANAHNALFTQHLNVLPDWDMFQTCHPYSGFHAAARCLSGGPVYITDEPGKHDIDLIHQISALNPRGQTVILRPSTVGKAIGVYDKYDEKGVLKIGAYDGRADTGTGLLGVFNLDAKEISFLLPITKFPGVNVQGEGRLEIRNHDTSYAQSRTYSSAVVSSYGGSEHGHEPDHIDKMETLTLDDKNAPGHVQPMDAGLHGNRHNKDNDGDEWKEEEEDEVKDEDKRWIFSSHRSGKITRPITPQVTTGPETLLHCKLPAKGYDVWTALPVHKVRVKREQKDQQDKEASAGSSVVELAVLGLLNKMVGGVAIISSQFGSRGRRLHFRVRLKALGTLGIWLRRVGGEEVEKDRWDQDQMMVLIQGLPVPADKLTVTKNSGGGDDGYVLQIDVLAAWKEMQLSPGWSNEVAVEVFIA